MDFLRAQKVFGIRIAIICLALGGANTGATGLGYQIGIDTDNVGHGKERCQASADLRKEVAPFAFLGLFIVLAHTIHAAKQ